MTALLVAVLLAVPAFAQGIHGVCGACHNQHLEDFQTHKHFSKGVSCDTCHGQSTSHTGAGGNAAPDRVAAPPEQPALCGTCHPDNRKGYEASKHGKIVMARSGKAAACTTCHGTHALRKPAAMIQQCNRCHQTLPASCKKDGAAEDKLACAACHNPHSLLAKK